MPNNFDDDVPSWLQDADSSGSKDDPLANLGWDDPEPKPAGQTDSLSLKGLTGTLPWNAQASGTSAPGGGDDVLANLSWDSPAGTPAASGGDNYSLKGLTGALPWNEQASDSPAPASAGQLSSWLDADDASATIPIRSQMPKLVSSDDLPDWLRDDDEPVIPAATITPPPAPAAPVAQESDWLSGGFAGEPGDFEQQFEEASDTSDWLQSSFGAPTPEATPKPATDALPDWLYGDNAIPPAEIDEPEPEPAETVPSWLSGGFAGEPTAVAEATDDQPDWLKGGFASAEPAVAAQADDETPSWLSSGFASEPAAVAEETDDQPDWLKGAFAADEPTVAAQADDETPSWLSGGFSSEPVVIAEETDDQPDWLKGAFAADEPTATTPVDEDSPSWLSGDFADEPTFEAETDDQPAWLQADTSNFVPQAAAIEETDFDALFAEDASPRRSSMDVDPAWGQSDNSDLTYAEWEQQQLEAEQGITKKPEITEVPDWFQGIEQGGVPFAEQDTASGGDYVPEWFMGVEELKADDAPDWLKAPEPARPPTASLPVAPPPPLPPAPDVELPNFDMFMGADETPPAATSGTGQIRRLTTPQPSAGAPMEAVPLDDLFGNEAGDSFDDLFGDSVSIPAAPAAALDLPDTGDLNWMVDTEPDATFATADNDSPDWLKGIEDTQAAAAAQPAPSFPEPVMEDELDWMGGLDFTNMPEPPPAPALAPEPVSQFAPPPLASILEDEDDFDLDSLLGTSEPMLPTGGALATKADLDYSLDSLSFDDNFLGDYPAAAASTLEPAAGELEISSDDEAESAEALPEWMSRLKTAEDQVVINLGGVEARFEQVPLVILSPELRALQEHSTATLMRAMQPAASINAGPLAGIEGALKLDPNVTQLGETRQTTAFNLSDSQQMRLESLQRVLEIVQAETAAQKIDLTYAQDDEVLLYDPVPKVTPPSARRRVKRQWDRLLITAALLIAVLLPFASDGFHLADDPPTELDEYALPLAAAVDSLETGRDAKPVLVVFEYAPTAAQELDPLVTAVLRDILAHEGRPIAVSANPIGLLNARQVLNELSEDRVLLAVMGRTTPLEAPADYAVMPFLSGGAVGVRSLARSESFSTLYFANDINGDNTELEVGKLDQTDFAFAIVVGERFEDTQLWAEHFQQTGIPMFALVTAAAEPVTRAYVSSKAYVGMLSGVQGAFAYDAVRNNTQKAPYVAPDGIDVPDPALSRWHSATLGILLAVIVIGLGTGFNLLRTLRRRR